MGKLHERIIKVVCVAVLLCAAAQFVGFHLRSLGIKGLWGYSADVTALILIILGCLVTALMGKRGSDP